MNKFNARKIRLDGYNFASQFEANGYAEAVLRLKAKEISDLRVHTRLPIKIGSVTVCAVESDIDYIEERTGKRVYIDFKGKDTAISKLKRKLVCAMYPAIDWQVVYSR